MKTKIAEELKQEAAKRTLYFPFIDLSQYKIEETVKLVKELNGDAKAVVVGGSLNIDMNSFNDYVKQIKENFKGYVMIIPSNIGMVSKYADGIFFISLLNSRNPYWITGSQALSAPLILKSGIEVIPTAYVVVEPGGISKWIGDANPLPRNRPEIIGAYALYSKLSGKEFMILDTGLGVKSGVPSEVISYVKKRVDIPIIYNGEVTRMDEVQRLSKAGADIVISSTVIKKRSYYDSGQLHRLIDMAKQMRKK